MQNTQKLEKIFLWIVRICLWAIPLLPFYISPSMLFPFITGKNFAFRILVEAAFVFWAGLAVVLPKYRPKLTPLLKAATIFIVVLFFADLLGANPYRSFFSNYERMEGFMMIGHLYLYFLMLVSVFKSRRDWLVFFHVSLLASLAVSFLGLMQRLGYRISLQGGFRVDSTIGNPTYLAAYLVFHMWMLLMLIHRFWKKWWLTGIYIAVLLFELMIIYFTATRGAVIALVVVGIPFVAALIALWPRIFLPAPGIRKWAAGALGLMILIPLVFWLMRSTTLVQSSPVLRRLTNYSLSEGTIQARFMIWGMSGKGFWDRPILGWGQENYYLVFQKYYNPRLWGDEPWFDRSHNIVFDWLIHSGFVGLTSFFAIIFVALGSIIRAMRKTKMSVWEGLILIALFLTHLIQNVFVFDNLNTYLLFFAFLAYTHYYTTHVAEEGKVMTPQITRKNTAGYGMSAGLLVVALIAGYFLHIKPIRQSKALIHALMVYQEHGTMDQLMNSFEDALGYDSFGTTEVREQVANIARDVSQNNRFSTEEKKRFIEFAIGELKKETAGQAKDVKHLLFLGSFLNRSGDINTSYPKEAEKVLEEAVFLSPTKQPLYFELAQARLYNGNTSRAVDDLKKAWDLDHHFREAGINLWTIAILTNRTDIDAEMKKQMPWESLDGGSLSRLGAAYQQTRRYAEMYEIYKRIVVINPDNAQYRGTFAALLAQLGKFKEAREQALEALRLNPSLKKDVDNFLRSLGR